MDGYGWRPYRQRVSALGPITCPITLLDHWHKVYRRRHGALLDEARTAVPYDGGLVRPHAVAQLCWVASRITLSRRLCALVGLELEPGEVAGWRRVDVGVWLLSTRRDAIALGDPEMLDANGDYLARTTTRDMPALAGITDPLDALRAAVAEMGGGE